jgi:pimeloyl-ACP methyl ester carboxylesterase
MASTRAVSEQPVIEERFVAIADMPTRVLEVPGDGPTVLLLHGFSDSADCWRPVLRELAAMSRRAVAVDLPGHGHAGRLDRPPLPHLDRFAAAFLRTYAGDDGAVLVGNSLGGLVALRAAARHETGLRAVAGLGPGGLAYHRRVESLTRRLALLDPTTLCLAEWLPVPPSLITRGAAALYTKRLARGRGDVEAARLYASHIRGMPSVVRLIRNVVALDADEAYLDADAFGRIRVPILLIWGDCDQLTDVRGAETLLDAVPTSRLVILDDCGHCPQVEFPDTVAHLLAELPASAHPDRGDAAVRAGPA